MKETVKKILKQLNIYHPLQSFYREAVFNYQCKRYRQKYKKFKGSGFTCNVCNGQYSKFVPDYPSKKNSSAIEKNQVIAGYGENVFCPQCMSTSRERLVLAQLATFDLEGKSILHLSPEKNIYGFIKNKAQVTTADLLPGFYKTIDGLVQKQDATHFSFAANQFDIVIANHIMEHIPDDKKAMKEIYRVLKPGGSAIMQVPYSAQLADTIEMLDINDPAKQSYLFGQKDHVRIYVLNDYVRRLRQVGFEVEIIPFAALKPFYYLAIQKDECFINISKPLSA